MRPVFVTSVPKSGTYLCAAILQQLGLTPLCWHVRETAYEDYSGASLEAARSNPDAYRRPRRLEETISRIQPGQFAVGHLRCNDRTRAALSGCCVILLRRDLRQCLVSHMVWLQATGREHNGWTRIADARRRLVAFLRIKTRTFAERSRAIELWRDHADLSLAFDELPRSADRIAAAVGCAPRGVDPQRIETLTKLPHPPWQEFWSPEAERVFLSLAGGSS